MSINISGSGIVEANLADNAVTLAKMAHGTDGELITYDATGAPANVAVGTSGQVLTSGGAGVAPTFQTAAGGGKVLQVVQGTTTTSASSVSTTYADTSLSASITPAAGSKVLVMFTQAGGTDLLDSAAVHLRIKLFRDSTEIKYYPSFSAHWLTGYGSINPGLFQQSNSQSYLDTAPGGDGSTSITYKTQFASEDGGVGDKVWVQYNSAVSTITLMEIGA